MDPDAELRALRELSHAVLSPEGQLVTLERARELSGLATELAERFLALDEYLCATGGLPEAWDGMEAGPFLWDDEPVRKQEDVKVKGDLL